MKTIKITTRTPWSRADNRACIRLYNKLLKLELAGKPYKKAPYVRELAEKQGRSTGSLEAKLMNVSGVRDSLGLPVIKGWKPLANAQKLLIEMITADYEKEL